MIKALMTAGNKDTFINSASFRDPSGFIYYVNGTAYRQVNNCYREHYDELISSGLYDSLHKKKLLIPHAETNEVDFRTYDGYKILKPENIPFVSYPYEWCFEQLKDAALLTLTIQKIALNHGMVLKDASAYNVQFLNGRPIFIDTLSFEKYIPGEPWIAYKQFCEHFFGPLCLLHYTDIRLYQLLKSYINGIPLDLTSRLLPFKTRFSFSILAHIHSHSFSQTYHNNAEKQSPVRLSLNGLKNLIQNLQSATSRLKLKRQYTEWDSYYSFTNYTPDSEMEKKKIVLDMIKWASPKTVWDLGSNNGLYSRIASDKGIKTISFDIDEMAVNANYNQVKERKEENILPLILDLSNPSGSLGWANRERQSLGQRGPADLVMALALIHHLAISNNIPIRQIAEYFSELSDMLIIEFVPKSDSKAQKLLSTRKDIYTGYSVEKFESDFGLYYNIIQKIHLKDSQRILYLLKTHEKTAS
jgi:hypothetical protein